jgi:hypothetical protein
MQVSGLEVVYDTSKPERQRLVSVKHGGKEVADEDIFEISVSGIIAKGGDHYDVFRETKILREFDPLGDLTIAYFRKYGAVPTPNAGRQLDLATRDQ